MKHTLLVLSLMAMVPLVQAADLTIQLDEVRNAKGNVSIALFASAESFTSSDTNAAEAIQIQQATTGEMRFTFHGLTPGDYAVSLHHDENKNSELEMDKAVPTEGYAYSNNVGKMKLPTFKDAAITVGGKNTSQDIHMIYQKAR